MTESFSNILVQSFPLLVKGTLITIVIWICAAIVAFLWGIITGILRAEKFRVPVLSFLLDNIVKIIRGIPLYVQMLIFYFVLPDLIKVDVPAMIAGVGALGLCAGSYISEITRCGIDNIPQGQWDATLVLGYTKGSSFRHIIGPQALRKVTPAFISEAVALMKGTSFLATLGTVELTKIGQNLVSKYMDPMPIYFMVAAIYLALNSVIPKICYTIERKVNG